MKPERLGSFVLVLGLLWLSGCNSAKTQPAAVEPKQTEAKDSIDAKMRQAQSLLDELSGKVVTETVDQMDSSRAFYLKALGRKGNDGGVLIARCTKPGKLDLFVSFDEFVDSQNWRTRVRLRFDENAPVHQVWGECDSHECLFSPAPLQLLRQLKKANVFMLEHRTFHSRTEVAAFDLADLHVGIPKLEAVCRLPSEEQFLSAQRAVVAAQRAAERKAAEDTAREKEHDAQGWTSKESCEGYAHYFWSNGGCHATPQERVSN